MAITMRKTLESDPLEWASKTYAALLCFGEAATIWRLLDMAAIAQKKIDGGDKNDFYQGKVMQATYFAEITFPTLMARLETCGKPSREVVGMPEGAF